MLWCFFQKLYKKKKEEKKDPIKKKLYTSFKKMPAKGVKGGKAGGKRQRRRKETYSRFLFKVLKQVHPDLGIKNSAMQVMDGMMYDVFDRVARQAQILCNMRKAQTISDLDVEAAVKLVFAGEVAKHGVTEAQKAVIKFNANST